MPSTQALKSRIRSVRSTRQITKAMQLVAASKMRRAQEATKASAPYASAARQLLTALSTKADIKQHPLFQIRPIKKRLLIAVASDKGLAGAYNNNIIKRYLAELTADEKAKVTTTSITVGKKVSQLAARLKDVDVLGAYDDIDDRPTSRQLHAILDTAKQQFVDGQVDAVDMLYTDYVSSISQQATVVRLFPAGLDMTESASPSGDVTYEPSAEVLLNSIGTRLVGAQIYQALLDAKASEHSMRMMAMKNATDNASDLVDDLTLEMNKARQAAITQELSEISGGVEALND